jgi:multimeric flavodoxin WrbA
MKIVVLNGSPKGDLSITLQYVLLIRKKFPEHQFKVFNIAQEIRKLEKDETAFKEVIDEIRSSDGVLWSFPLYFLLVHSHYKRFIELVFERGVGDAFGKKHAASLSTSIHFFDHTAHNYINAICDDLDMRYVGAFSPHYHDMAKERERERLLLFARHFFLAMETDAPTQKGFAPLLRSGFEYRPGPAPVPVPVGDKKVLILTDCEKGQVNLDRMVERVRQSFVGQVEIVNLHDVDIKGGCMGCIQCGFDGRCAYGSKDGYMEFFNTKVKTADVLVFAGAIKDRYLSSRWKLFFDRSFFNTHIPVLLGKQVGFVISGPLQQVPNLREILEAWAEGQQADPVGFVTDEGGDSAELDALLQRMAEQLVQFAVEDYKKPVTYLSVGGRKIFRDEIWGDLRFVFQADHRFYSRHGVYDFPQRRYKMRAVVAMMMLLTKIPRFREEIRRRTKAEMVKPYQKVVEKA